MKVIDLTQTLVPGSRKFASEPAMKLKTDGWNASILHMYSHVGTHMDAPSHFIEGSGGIDSIPPENLIVDCYVADLQFITPGALITTDWISSIREKIEPGDGILFRTGWSKYIDNEVIYRNALPRMSKELAEWLVKRKVKLIGVETPSIADVNNIAELQEIHEILLGAGIVIIEGLTNLNLIKKNKIKLIALPLKIKGCDGSPCRVIALE